jgi:hypothetical protein
MKRLAIAAAASRFPFLTYFQFPGHTWLQQDSQILHARYSRTNTTTPFCATTFWRGQSHLGFTIYDEGALPFRRFAG